MLGKWENLENKENETQNMKKISGCNGIPDNYRVAIFCMQGHHSRSNRTLQSRNGDNHENEDKKQVGKKKEEKCGVPGGCYGVAIRLLWYLKWLL